MICPLSYYKHLANQSLDWLPMDTEERFNQHLKSHHHYSALRENGWIDNPFKYTFNSHGFRCEEFSDKPNAVFLGCSFTAGIGLPIEATWASIVAKELGLANFNLGQGGGSGDACFRLFNHWHKILKPQYVFLLAPSKERTEIAVKGGHLPQAMKQLTPHGYPKEYSSFYETWITNDSNTLCNNLKNILAIEMLCTRIGAKFVNLDLNTFMKLGVEDDFARDLAHPGVKANQNTADYALRLARSL